MELLLPIVSIILTVVIFVLCKKLYKRWKSLLLSPILICPIVLIILLMAFHTQYPTYNSGAKWLTKLLGPATVAFAVPMYKHFQLLKKHGVEIIVSLAVGSFTAIVSSFLIALWMKLSPNLINSLVPRSITTPIAMDISKTIGGIPTMTAVFVIITGLTGSILGPILIRLISIRSSTAKGLLLGMGAHGAGTSKAFEMGELEGTFASLAMVVAAIISIILAYTFFPILQTELTP
ncbi:CidB/LrgB family autolysis modulator [Heyndrickxia acidicola]|uniref:CidB/LrgB family autolysis modulator n=1 Tax=Heyndrickxia acidicola TaxID=209389 RepID=A0ABU6MEE8_9BACI|nr:CidB/LrgB family autolysis modulator [Heyndrickxia acidicola]MED1203026.1 CidB/LrgB family autolysis modulator [Heyndrickxia acidicola]